MSDKPQRWHPEKLEEAMKRWYEIQQAAWKIEEGRILKDDEPRPARPARQCSNSGCRNPIKPGHSQCAHCHDHA